MTTYAQNSKLKRAVVTLADGTKEYLKHSKLIDGKYYRVQDQCIMIERRWYNYDSPLIFYNNSTKQWETRLFKVIKRGVIDIKEDGSIVTGEYTEDLCRNCKIGLLVNNVKHVLNCISFEIPKEKGFVEHLNDAVWVSNQFLAFNSDYTPLKKYYSESVVNKIQSKVNEFNKPDKLKLFSFPENSYNAEDSGNFEAAIRSYNSYNSYIPKRVRRAAKLLGDISFG